MRGDTVHQGFSDWYRVASIDPKDVDLKARWTGVQAFADECSVTDLLDAARTFFGLPTKTEDFVDRFRAPFKAADDKFPMVRNDAEIRVLAGSLLVAMFSYKEGWCNAAALSLTCGSFHDHRSAPVGDIVVLAREELSRRSAELRSIKEATVPDVEQFNAKIAKRLDDL